MEREDHKRRGRGATRVLCVQTSPYPKNGGALGHQVERCAVSYPGPGQPPPASRGDFGRLATWMNAHPAPHPPSKFSAILNVFEYPRNHHIAAARRLSCREKGALAVSRRGRRADGRCGLGAQRFGPLLRWRRSYDHVAYGRGFEILDFWKAGLAAHFLEDRPTWRGTDDPRYLGGGPPLRTCDVMTAVFLLPRQAGLSTGSMAVFRDQTQGTHAEYAKAGGSVNI